MAALVPATRVDEPPSQRGDAAEVREKVEHCPLADEQLRERTGDRRDDVARRKRIAVALVRGPLNVRIERRKDHPSDRAAGEHTGFAGDDVYRGPVRGRDQRLAGQITAVAEVFQQRERDQSRCAVAFEVAKAGFDGHRSSRAVSGHRVVRFIVR